MEPWQQCHMRYNKTVDKPLYTNGRFLIASGVALVIITIGWFSFDLGIVAPPRFQGEKTLAVLKGASAQEIARLLNQEGIIRRPSDFLLYVKLTGADKTIKPGNYVFREPLSVPRIVAVITSDAAEHKIRIREGWTNAEIATYLEGEGLVSKKDFLKSAESFEGYLFPDTYQAFENVSSQELVLLMRGAFDKKVAPLREAMAQKNISLKDMVIMASLVEKESAGDEDRAVIAGILWKRLKNNRPLQVDATLSYLTGKESKELTTDDLQIDSPYNTYRNPGLPAGPIGNPGLEAMKAAVFPKDSPYWFYLHDKEGHPHYAVTFEEHIANKDKYLR